MPTSTDHKSKSGKSVQTHAVLIFRNRHFTEEILTIIEAAKVASEVGVKAPRHIMVLTE